MPITARSSCTFKTELPSPSPITTRNLPAHYIFSSKQVIWLSDFERTKGYAVDFLSVSLHAVSRDPEAYPSPCIYTQIETAGDETEGSESESNDKVDLSRVTEMRLIPSDPNQLDTLFDMFCQCASLNPEPIDEEVEEHDWVFIADQMEDVEADCDDYISQNLTNLIGHSNGDHTVLQLQIHDLRFEDADEGP